MEFDLYRACLGPAQRGPIDANLRPDAQARVDWRPLPGHTALEALSPGEAQRVSYQRSEGHHALPMIQSLVEDQIQRTPDALAAISEDRQTITYSELGRRANQLACRLIRHGVGKDCVVGICLDRSLEMIIALLAVLKAGGAYLPLDRSYPRDRLAFMIEDAAPSVLITSSALRTSLPAQDETRILLIDTEAVTLAEESAPTPGVGSTPDDLAYIIYTSGSTGQPKGVAMPHSVLSNLLVWQLGSWTAPAAARTLQFTTLSFDVAFQEIFATLCAGGTLVLISEETRRDPVALLRLLRGQEVERIFLPFVALQQLATAFQAERILPAKLRDLITAGEQLQITPQIRALFEQLPGCTLHNQYGPAETHVATAFTLRGRPDSWPLLPPIGQPIPNARIHILDEKGRPAAEGARGEIYIGGAVLGRGYWNRTELTAERFIRDPFSDDASARLYRTGDLGRLLPDTNIQYLGRDDQQVKIRGVRVELGEIEAVMAQHPGILQVAVCAKDVAVGDKRLHAYFVPRASMAPTHDELRSFLEAKLAPQFIPSIFVSMSSLPLTPSGKLDRLALASLAERDVQTLYDAEAREVKAPSNETQAKLASIWEGLLGKRPIGITDNFFDLGGHSLLAVQLAAETQKILGKAVTTGMVFSAPTIEALAELLSRQTSDKQAPALIDFQTSGSKAPFFCVPGLLDLARALGPDQPFYGLNLDLLTEVSSVEFGISEWAGRCVEGMQRVQPRGPYYIGGSKGAAALALEIASQLQIAGEKVGLIAFFDPAPPPGSNSRFRLGKYFFQLRYFFSLSRKEQMEYFATAIDRMNQDLRWRLNTLWDPGARRVRGIDASLGRFDPLESFASAIASLRDKSPWRSPVRDSPAPRPHQPGLQYSPPKNVAAPVAVFLPRDWYPQNPSDDDPRLSWRHIIDGTFEVHMVPGRPSNFMRNPNVEHVAQVLGNYLQSQSQLIKNAYGAALRLSVLLTTPWLISC